MNADLTSKRTPLRNSKLANKPFRSPLISITPKNDVKTTSSLISSITPKNDGRRASPLIYSPTPSNVGETATPRRSSVFPDKPQLKKRRIEISVFEEDCENKLVPVPSKIQLLALKKRIRDKRQEVESLKAQLACRKKHNKEDLRKEIEKWRTACQKALQQFQKDWNETNAEGAYFDMRKILSMLGISEGIVKFPEDVDLT